MTSGSVIEVFTMRSISQLISGPMRWQAVDNGKICKKVNIELIESLLFLQNLSTYQAGWTAAIDDQHDDDEFLH